MTFRLRSFYSKQVIKFPGLFLLAGNVRNKGDQFVLRMRLRDEVMGFGSEGCK